MNKPDQDNKNPFALMEEEVQAFWEKSRTFNKSVEKEAPNGEYVFYDGPPFGTGEPHYGHILSSVSKDVVPRYWTMKGFRVERRWGWDCHGLPIENIIEKDLGISGKKQIEELGIAKFNEACRAQVLEYADVWDVMVRRIGRWVDFKNSYKTMDADFMESVWWGFKQLYDKDLVYEGRKVLLYCPRCETPISNFEVAMDNSYQDITETSVYVKFKVISENLEIRSREWGIKLPEDIFILAWTTTPWTLPGNVALAINKDIEYVLVKETASTQINSKEDKRSYSLPEDGYYILAKEVIVKEDQRLGSTDAYIYKGKNYRILKTFKGSMLEGLEYKPLFEVPALRDSGKKKVYTVQAADFVTTEDGTGVVHTAVVYGEDDYNLGKELDLPVIPALDEKGHFNETVPELAGTYFLKANKTIIEKLKEREQLFREEKIEHSYPHCHRCETQLFYNAIPAWFINIDKIRDDLVVQNEKINWYPTHLKEGRFKQGLLQAPDWNISRNRYFATPIPIWRCSECSELEVIDSIKKLEERSGEKGIKDIHSHLIDDLKWGCAKCNQGEMRRISEVFDCWVESGSMSFAQHHYPFENREKLESTLPAQFISEYISQTRAWFYVMHVMSVALFNKNSYENVVTTGVILNEKGEKMSKSKKNYPDPWKMINEFGVDALRLYLMNSTVMHADNLFFNERDLRDIFRKHIMILWNIYKFFDMFAGGKRSQLERPEGENVLDKWILSRLSQFISEVTTRMDHYDMPRAIRPMTEFIDELSTWYLRRSRDRFKGQDREDKEQAMQTLGFVLQELSKVLAPFMPFISERIWQLVTGYKFKDKNRSVHLEAWPEAGNVDKMVLAEMAATRQVVELGLKARDEAGIKVRQPLRELVVTAPKTVAIKNKYIELIKDEVNVKEVNFKGNAKEIKVELNTKIDEELKMEGLKREMVRFVNALRKQAGLTPGDKVKLYYQGSAEIKKVMDKFTAEIMKETISTEISDKKSDSDIKKGVKINGEAVTLILEK